MATENKSNQHEELSPEEKLLKVIQNGGQSANKPSPEEKLANAVKQQPVSEPKQQIKPPAMESSKVAPPSPVVPPKRIVVSETQKETARAEPPKLKLTKVSPDHDKEREARAAALAKVMANPTGGDGQTVQESVPKGKKISITTPVPALSKTGGREARATGKLHKLKKEEEGKHLFAVISKFVAVGIVLVIGVSAYEIWGAVKWENGFKKNISSENSGTGNNPVAQMEVYPDPYVFEDLQKSFAEKNLFGVATEVKPQATVQQTVVVTTGPLEEALKNLQLIGHSKLADGLMEGIVLDKKENKMYFLKKGDKFPFNNEELDVVEVLADRLVVKKGNATSVIK